jgi:hypothetical protein
MVEAIFMSDLQGSVLSMQKEEEKEETGNRQPL